MQQQLHAAAVPARRRKLQRAAGYCRRRRACRGVGSAQQRLQLLLITLPGGKA